MKKNHPYNTDYTNGTDTCFVVSRQVKMPRPYVNSEVVVFLSQQKAEKQSLTVRMNGGFNHFY